MLSSLLMLVLLLYSINKKSPKKTLLELTRNVPKASAKCVCNVKMFLNGKNVEVDIVTLGYVCHQKDSVLKVCLVKDVPLVG